MEPITLTRVETPHGRHYRVPDGRLFVGVTTVLDVVAKPFLVDWAAKLEREHILTTARTIYDQLPFEEVHVNDYMALVQKEIGRPYAHRVYTKAAADWGTQLHEYLEWHNLLEMGHPVGPEPALPPGGHLARDQYHSWRLANQIYMQAAEMRICSYRYGYAGTIDWWGVVQSWQRHTVGDWKSSKSIHKEMYLQNTAYIHALIEMGHVVPPVDGAIVRLPKDPTRPYIQVKRLPWEMQGRLFEVFLHALELWRWWKQEA